MISFSRQYWKRNITTYIYIAERSCKSVQQLSSNISENSADLVSENFKLIINTIAYLFVFGNYWRENLNRAPHNRTKHNVWYNIYYSILDPSSAQIIAILFVFVILKNLFRDINIFSRDFDAITPAALAAAITKLLLHWIIWKRFVLIYYNIQNNILADKIISFANQLQYPAWSIARFCICVSKNLISEVLFTTSISFYSKE